MSKEIKKMGPSAVHVTNISPAAMKVILEKISATSRPGDDRSVFVKGPTDFAQDGSFYKFSRPGETDISVQYGGDFKLNADIVKNIERR